MKRAILTALDRFFDFILYGFDSEPGRAQDYHYLRSDESWLKTSAQKPTGGIARNRFKLHGSRIARHGFRLYPPTKSNPNETEVRESSVAHG
jgi:hypothetical protein